MAEHDSHYNDTDLAMPGMKTREAAAAAGNNDGLTTPLPDFEEGGPVGPLPEETPVIPLPDVGEGGPVYDPGGEPDIPLPFPGEGGPVYDPGSKPVIPLPFPGEGGPVYPGNSSGNITVLPHPHPVPPSLSPQYFGQVRFLNASANTFPVTISIDGTPYAINSRFATISNYDWISDGFHTVTVRRTNGLRSILLQQTFSFVAGQKVTMVLTDSPSGGLEMLRVVDTGCRSLPYNSACYRLANMAYSGSNFDLTLTGGETVFRNVRFQKVTSYKQAIAGAYQFSLSNAGTFTFVRELPIIMIGAIVGGVIQQPLLTYSVNIMAGRSYTSYVIGNTWSSNSLRVLTVED